MNYLMWQLWLCLLIALLLGAAFGWLLRGGCKKKIFNIINDWSQRLELVEEERDLFALKAQDAVRFEHENKSLLGRLRSMESGANLASDVLNENKSRLDRADLKLSEMKSLLEQRDSELVALQRRLNDADNKPEIKGRVDDSDASLSIELRSKDEALEELTKDYQSAMEEAETMRVQRDEYEKINHQLLDHKSEAKAALSVAEALNIENEKKNTETQSQLELTNKKNQDLTEELDSLAEKLDQADKKSADDAKQIAEVTDLYDKSIANSRAFKSQIIQSGNDLRAELSDKKVLCENLEQDIQFAKEEAKKNADLVVSVEELLKTKEKENDVLVTTELQLQMALSTAESVGVQHEEKIAEYETKLERLTNKLDASKAKELTDVDELKVMQGLLVAHEKGNQDLEEKESLLQEELSELKMQDTKNKETAEKYEAKLEKLNSELNASREKELANADELKIVQSLVAAHERGNRDLLEKEGKLQIALSDLEAQELENKETVSQDASEIKVLEENLQLSKKKEKSALDEIEMMQAVLDAHEKGNQDLVEKEDELQQALMMAEKSVTNCKDELELKDKEAQQSNLAYSEVKQQLEAQNLQVEQIKLLISTYEKNSVDMLNKQSLLKARSSDCKQKISHLKDTIRAKEEQIKLLQSTSAMPKEKQTSDTSKASKLINYSQDVESVDKVTTLAKSINSYDIEEIDGIGKGFGKRLRKIGIHTTTDLLEKCRDDNSYAQHIAKAMNQSEKTVKTWLDMADLLRIDGVDGKYAELLYLSGINSSGVLAASDMNKVRSKMKNVVKNQHHAKKTPTKKITLKWIASANKLVE